MDDMNIQDGQENKAKKVEFYAISGHTKKANMKTNRMEKVRAHVVSKYKCTIRNDNLTISIK